MISNPKISVVMSICNEPEEWLRKSIDSIINQTFSDFEFIIINDNPECEQNRLLLDDYQAKDNRIVIINNDVNIGLTRSLNKGLAKVKGEFIARMDGDDISHKDRLEIQYNFMIANSEIGACGSYIKIFGDNTRIDKSFYLDSIHIKSSIIYSNPIPHPTAFIRQATLKKHLIFYDENYTCAQDYKLWSDLAPFTKLANIPKVLLSYRVQKMQISQLRDTTQKGLAKKIRMSEIKNYLGNQFSEFENLKSKKEKFIFIAKKRNKSLEKSFVLLTIYLSFNKYRLIDFMVLTYYIHFCVLKKNMLIILKKNLQPEKYADLI